MDCLYDTVIAQIPGVPKDKVEFSSTNNLAVVKTTYIPAREGKFYDYHFIIPIQDTPPIIVDNKEYPLKPNFVFSSNPNQLHKPVDTGDKSCLFLGLFIEKAFLRETSKTLFSSEDLQFDNKCFSLNPQTKSLLYSFIEESSTQQLGNELFLQALSIQIAVKILREGNHNLNNLPLMLNEYSDKKCINRAIDFLMSNYNSTITLNDLAREVNYSPFYFLRIFKQSTGMTPFEFLLEIKLEKAKNLLKHTDFSMTEICYLSGFTSTSHFTQAFKRKTGVSPTNYKKNM